MPTATIQNGKLSLISFFRSQTTSSRCVNCYACDLRECFPKRPDMTTAVFCSNPPQHNKPASVMALLQLLEYDVDGTLSRSSTRCCRCKYRFAQWRSSKSVAEHVVGVAQVSGSGILANSSTSRSISWAHLGGSCYPLSGACRCDNAVYLYLSQCLVSPCTDYGSPAQVILERRSSLRLK
jgi:hypothetical protein